MNACPIRCFVTVRAAAAASGDVEFRENWPGNAIASRCLRNIAACSVGMVKRPWD